MFEQVFDALEVDAPGLADPDRMKLMIRRSGFAE